ncbi:MAG: hypothetical protein ACRD2J_12830 [Thermoanaerobaculia bacterium]
MLRAWVAALLAVALSPAALPALELDTADVALLADLLAEGGYGRLPIERAAFLVLTPGGERRCVLWPVTAELRAARFRGTIPPGTFAIAHTHPLDQPNPSPGDIATAESLGLPVIVITPRRIAAAVPFGGTEVLATGWWSREAGAAACRDQD